MIKKLVLLITAFYAGVLLAPRSGAETRKNLSNKMKDQTKN